MQRRGVLVGVFMVACKSHGDAAAPLDAPGADADGDPGLATCAHVGFLGTSPPQAMVTGGAPDSVAARDLDGDGIPDLVTASYQWSGTVSVMLGAGRGAFKPAVDYPSGDWTTQVEIADLDGDGILDIASSNSLWITVLLGRGDGSFDRGPPAAKGLTAGVSALEIADLNGDGKPDLVVLHGGTLSVLLGNGDATFQAPLDYAWNIEKIAIADLNDDGHPDLVTASNFDDTLRVVWGDGNGMFRSGNDIAKRSVQSLALADLNSDGKPDIITAGSSDVAVLLLTGDGVLRSATSYPIDSSPRAVAIADVTGDGKPDLLITQYAPDRYDTVSVWVGNGDGTFQPEMEYVTGADTSTPAVLDVDQDDKLDIVTVGANGAVRVLAGRGDGTFDSAPILRLGVTAVAVAVADVNRDGALDLIAPSSDLALPQVRVFLAASRARFRSYIDAPTQVHPRSIAVADLDSDGNPDILLGGFGIGVLLGNGDGTFRPEVRYPGLDVFAVADMNGDGKPDLLVAAGRDLGVRLGRGDGTFEEARHYPTSAQHLAVADVNGDGRLDVVASTGAHSSATSGTGALHVLLGNGDGSLQTEVITTVPSPLVAAALVDLDHDGRVDLVGAAENRSRVLVLRGQGDPAFMPLVNYPTGGFPTSLAIIDANGDGKPDVVTSNQGGQIGGGTVSLLLGNGDGTLRAAADADVRGSGAPEFMTAADVNGDHHPDLIVINSYSRTARFLLSSCIP